MKPSEGMLFAWEAPPQSALGRWTRRLSAALVFGGLFLLPFFGWLAAEPTPYSDPAGFFSFTPPEGWSTDDSGHMGPGLVAKGSADAAGAEPLIHLTHEGAGIVTLEVRWQTLLGQLRFDNERVRFLAIEEHPDANPPYAQSIYLFQRGDQGYQALTRLVLAKGRFYQMTFAGTEEEFERFYPALVAAFDSLRTGGK
ncbi:MAG: hypothetical protein ACYC9Y_04210 [Candidatus Methylomirabilia bacterium]